MNISSLNSRSQFFHILSRKKRGSKGPTTQWPWCLQHKPVYFYITGVWLPTCTKLFIRTLKEHKWKSAKMLNVEALYTPLTLEQAGDRGALGHTVHVTWSCSPSLSQGRKAPRYRKAVYKFYQIFWVCPFKHYTFWSSELCWNHLGPISNGSKHQLTLLVVITACCLYISYAFGCGSPLLKLTDMSVLNIIHLWGTVFHKSWLFSPWVCSARNQILTFFFF